MQELMALSLDFLPRMAGLTEHGVQLFLASSPHFSPLGTSLFFLCAIDVVKPKPTTFHRAFDVVCDPSGALEDIIELGFSRLLTSGLASSALEGAPAIHRLVQQAGDRIVIMPGGGITEKNLERILSLTGAKEFHCSARKSVASGMTHLSSDVYMGAALRPPEYGHKVCDSKRVLAFATFAKAATFK
eukprot:m.22725 g.22725  ORF g.22725 m.22725 type:complete len:187 (+) comp28389_c0_seq1:313-873(+)